MFTSILVAIDGSPHAERALKVGCELAAKYQAKLTLVHVLGHGPLPKGLEHWAEVEHLAHHEVSAAQQVENVTGNLAVAEAVGESEGFEFRLHEIAGKQILKQAREIAKQHGVSSIKEYVDTARPADCILQRAADEAADTIVMGSRGLSEIKGLLLGSVSHKVSQICDAICVIVK